MNLIQIIIPVVAVVWQEGGMVKSEPLVRSVVTKGENSQIQVNRQDLL